MVEVPYTLHTYIYIFFHLRKRCPLFFFLFHGAFTTRRISSPLSPRDYLLSLVLCSFLASFARCWNRTECFASRRKRKQNESLFERSSAISTRRDRRKRKIEFRGNVSSVISTGYAPETINQCKGKKLKTRVCPLVVRCWPVERVSRKRKLEFDSSTFTARAVFTRPSSRNALFAFATETPLRTRWPEANR